MKSVAHSYFWWFNFESEIEALVKSCAACQAVKVASSVTPLHPWIWPAKPWQRIHIDKVGPFRGKMFLVIVDAHSKWPEVCEVSSATAEATVTVLHRLFSRFGLPSQLVSDNGSQFVSAVFEKFLKQNGVKHIKSAPYHSSSNGLAECFVQTFKQAIKVSEGSNLSLQHRLDRFLLSYCTTPHATTGEMPNLLFLGQQIRTRFDLLRPDCDRHVCSKQATQKSSHDTSRTKDKEFQVNSRVLAKDWRPAHAGWKSGIVTEDTGPLSDSGEYWKRHTEHLREWVPLSTEGQETNDV